MSDSTHKLIVNISNDLKEIASAWLNLAGVDAILDTEYGLVIYKEDGNLERRSIGIKNGSLISNQYI